MWLDDADVRKLLPNSVLREIQSSASAFLLLLVAFYPGTVPLASPARKPRKLNTSTDERSEVLPTVLSVQALQFVFEVIRDHTSVHLLGSRVFDASRLISAARNGYLRRLLAVLCVRYVLRRTHSLSEPPHFVQNHGAHVWHLVYALKGKIECGRTLRLVRGVVPD